MSNQPKSKGSSRNVPSNRRLFHGVSNGILIYPTTISRGFVDQPAIILSIVGGVSDSRSTLLTHDTALALAGHVLALLEPNATGSKP